MHASRVMPPKSTLAIGTPTFSCKALTLPGMARHMRLYPFEKGGGNHSLSERKAAVIRWNFRMEKDLESAAPKQFDGARKQREVLESAATQTNFVHAVPFAKLTTDDFNHKRDG